MQTWPPRRKRRRRPALSRPREEDHQEGRRAQGCRPRALLGEGGGGVDPAALAAAEEKAADATALAQDLQRKAAEADKRAAEADKRAAEAARQLAEAQKKATEASHRVFDAERRLADNERRVQEAEGKVAALDAVNADLRAIAGSNAARVDALQAELVSLKEQLAAFKLRCPKCGANMVEEQYEGITIDRCTGCNGIYFDAGETEQLIQKIQEGQQKPGFWSGLFKRKPKTDAPPPSI